MNLNKPLFVVNVVGLTPSLLGEHTPNINKLIKSGTMTPLQSVFPAVTTTAQASMLTGLAPAQHGIVGNGWYFRDIAEVKFWMQPNQLIKGEKVWDVLKRHYPEFKVSQLFWWYNMYANVDYSITPRPHYPADGRKIPDLYSTPSGLHQQLEQDIGKFPFFNFWGPKSDIRSSCWIVDCAIAHYQRNPSHLQFVYLPHLDYNLQRLGMDDPAIFDDVRAIDSQLGKLIDFADEKHISLMLVSEYGIHSVSEDIALNRLFRKQGWLSVRESLGTELLDAGASEAFAVADHQIAHIYVKNPKKVRAVAKMLREVAGIEHVLDKQAQAEWGIAHPRSGELIAVAKSGYWFSYYYWLDEGRRPDFANTVDIHRKPGYDPAELFIDPQIRFPVLKVISRLIQKKLGLRMLMDVIPTNGAQVKGSHGRLPDTPEQGPLLISSEPIPKHIKALESGSGLPMTAIFELILAHFSVPKPAHDLTCKLHQTEVKQVVEAQ
ncbi:alkaline phosphatase family protein [Pseudoalteromonas sp. T1lg65]|uniref:alkaline phosphatase family protein n=1 Tax=Pseudoalteromonas sp. T1lg65 TaxID=2077101 RepID=UPI003F79ED92